MDRNMDSHASSSSNGAQQLLINLFPNSFNTVLEFTGLMRNASSSSSSRSSSSFLDSPSSSVQLPRSSSSNSRSSDAEGGAAEVAIRIIDEQMVHPPTSLRLAPADFGGSPMDSPRYLDVEEGGELGQGNINANAHTEGDAAENAAANGANRYDFQPLARWVEQILPFTILLLMVFIRQHMQGLAVTFWIYAVLIKGNEVLRKQIALKGERKKAVTISIAGVLLLHVLGVYWWYRAEAFWRPLMLLPPRKIPKFWHAIFVIMVNDVMVRQAGMALKCVLLLTYKSTRGRHFRRQGQLLTVVEYLLLLYRALVPAPVWYRFFLNKDYGNLFSSLTTGLYLTFKLTSVFEKLQTFIAAVRLLSRSEVLYGVHATTEEVLTAGDMCAICQEKMHSPITLRCKHIFCEDCVSEWFERERTCPLCRAVVKSADFKSFADGSTSLFVQFF